MAKVSKKIKPTGRPASAPNKGNSHVRDEQITVRVTEGFTKTLAALQVGNSFSRADIIHEALQLLAFRKLSAPADLYYVNRII